MNIGRCGTGNVPVDIILTSKQQGSYNQFVSFVYKEIPSFILHNASVSNALLKYGLLVEFGDSRRDAVRASADVFARNFQILRTVLARGAKPVFSTIPSSMMMTSNDIWGAYTRETQSIAIASELVDAWQKEPERNFLYRALMSVAMHELVHHLNHLLSYSFFGRKEKDFSYFLNTSSLHLIEDKLPGADNSFVDEAFSPLGWEQTHYKADAKSLDSIGVSVDSN